MSDCSLIQFVYFDLGNVLVSFDPQRGCQQVAAWAGCQPEQVYEAVWESGLEEVFETGQCSPVEFTARIAAHLGGLEGRLQPSGAPLLDLISDMFSPIEQTLTVIQRLQKAGIRIGILSNTCHAHWDWIQRQGWPVASGWSEIDILSFEIGSMKPAAEIYAAAQQAAAVPAESIYFTDDREENVAGALRAGWQADLFRGPKDLHKRLGQLGVPAAAGAVE